MHRFKSKSHKNIIGLKLSGYLTYEEYNDIVPFLEKKIQEFGKIRLLIELDHWKGWNGIAAPFKDAIFVLKNSFNIQRVAFVVDSKTDCQAVLIDKPFSPWLKDHTRFFSQAEMLNAWKWISEGIKDFALPTTAEMLLETPLKKKVRYGPKTHVLIVGNGISGMTLAALLQKRGFTPHLIQGNAKTEDADKVLYLWPTACNCLKTLGIYKKILKHAKKLDTLSLLTNQEKHIQTYEHSFLNKKFGPLLAIPKGIFHKIIKSSLFPSIFYETIKIKKIKENDNELKIAFSDNKQRKYDCLIWADSLYSPQLELLFENIPKEFPTQLLGAYFSIVPTFSIPKEALEYKNAEGIFRCVPVKNKLYITAILKSNEKQKPTTKEAQIALLKEHFKSFPKLTSEVFSHINSSLPFWFGSLCESGSNNQSKAQGRIAFLEEDIYSYAPETSIEDTLGIESAYLLAETLSKSDSEHIVFALNSYEKRRKKREDIAKEKFFQTIFTSPLIQKGKDNVFSKVMAPQETYAQFWTWFCEENF